MCPNNSSFLILESPRDRGNTLRSLLHAVMFENRMFSFNPQIMGNSLRSEIYDVNSGDSVTFQSPRTGHS